MNRLSFIVMFVGTVFLLSISAVDVVFAAGGIGEIGWRIGTHIEQLAKLVEKGGYFSGIVFVVFSLISFANAKRQGTSMTVPIVFFIAGVLLLSLGSWISTGSTSLFGDDAAKKALDQLSSGGSHWGQ